jgi:GTPase SAR1 family protein
VTLKLHIWDTAGDDKFRSILPLYFKNSHAAILVYAIDDKSSFLALDKWIESLDDHSFMPKMVKHLVGNKSDLD